mmetsp:Transcript_88051/g.247505  ORF Transcript_88051/g.247505 Transcript_88051/m.247505 type:complete len:373 (+) Transcript_88051:233-1351(+)
MTSAASHAPKSHNFVSTRCNLSPSVQLGSSASVVPSLSWMIRKIKATTSKAFPGSRLCTHFSTNCHQVCQLQPTRDQPQPDAAGLGKTCTRNLEYNSHASSFIATTPSRLCPKFTRTSSTLRILTLWFFTSSATIKGAFSGSSVRTNAMLRNFCNASTCRSTGIVKACQAATQSLGFLATPSHNLFNTSMRRASLRAPSSTTGSSVSSPTSTYNGSSIKSPAAGLAGGKGATSACGVASMEGSLAFGTGPVAGAGFGTDPATAGGVGASPTGTFAIAGGFPPAAAVAVPPFGGPAPAAGFGGTAPLGAFTTPVFATPVLATAAFATPAVGGAAGFAAAAPGVVPGFATADAGTRIPSRAARCATFFFNARRK